MWKAHLEKTYYVFPYVNNIVLGLDKTDDDFCISNYDDDELNIPSEYTTTGIPNSDLHIFVG